MAPNEQGPNSPKQHRVGEHWSAGNPIPTIQKFMQHLDVEKREREKHEQDVTAKQEEEFRQKVERGEADEATAHKPRQIPKGKTRMVTDPTTGRDIEVEDQDEDSMETVKNPTVISLLCRNVGPLLSVGYS